MIFSNINKKEFHKTNKISRKYNKIWKKYAGRTSIGDCSNLYQRLKPTSYYDFYVKYTKDGEETALDRQSNPYCGRTESEIETIARNYMNECNDSSFTFEEYLMNVYNHCIIETYDGQKKEQEIADFLTKIGYTYEKPIGDEDAMLGIDFKVYTNGKLTFLLQIKPISFFMGVNNNSLIEDRLYAFHKGERAKNKLNVPTWFMVYQSNDEGNFEWLTLNDKYCMKLEDLCDKTNGYPRQLNHIFKPLS